MTPRAFAATVTLLVAGCSSPATTPVRTAVSFSDVHFDPFFDPSLLATLQAAPESEWARIFAGSGHLDPGRFGGTTNYVLLQRALAAIQAQKPALVVFGGDILVQDFNTIYFALTHTQDEAAMQAFALKTVTFVVHQIRAALGTTPVYFTLGNWDDYAGSFGLKPGDPFLTDTSALFYDDLLQATTDRATFEVTYRTGGYYAAEVPGTSLVVIGLNTLFLAPQAPAGIDAAVDLELDWLDSTLAAIQSSGQRAWIVTHVPPGGDLATTGGDVDPQGHVTQPTMMLQAQYQDRLLTILDAHRDALAAAFTGHTHMDEFRIAVTALQGIPGITPLMGNAPAFKSFTVGEGSTLEDYVSWSLDLSDASASFQPYYDFQVAYGLPAPLSPSLEALVLQLASPGPAQAGYRGRYGSGHPPEKAITDLNWPVYRCGITFMGSQGIQDCVNDGP
jgi:sphingomyelin phosphodiesterase acid-like 3